jgi:hypothetical protein
VTATAHHWYLALINLHLGDRLLAALDVLIVAFLVYHLLMLAKGTRAWQVLSGLVVFVLVLLTSEKLGLVTLNWIVRQMFFLSPVAIVILFLPELRHALEGLGGSISGDAGLWDWPQRMCPTWLGRSCARPASFRTGAPAPSS